MNNKGQSLVLFILLLPLIFIVMALILEVGFLYINKKQVDSEIRYTLKNSIKANIKDEFKIQNMIKENLGNDIKVDVKNSNERLVIEVIKKHKFLIIKKDYNIKIKFYGYLSDDKVIIEKG